MDYEKLCCERLLEWQQGQAPGPLHLTVFPTFRCNLNCAICSRHWHTEPRIKEGELTNERLLELVDESEQLGTKYWTIGGGGEPMVRRDAVVEMCKRIKHYDMIGSLQTNGTLFTPEAVEELVRANWDEVSISVDGLTAETNDRLRFPGVFEESMETMRQFATAKQKFGRSAPGVRVACVLSRFNSDSLCEMVEKMHEMGATTLVFIQMIVYADGMADLAPTAEQFSQLRRQYERARALGLRLGLETALAALPPGETPAARERKNGGNRYNRALCVEPWLSLVVLPWGRCAPCCVFGNGMTDSLQERNLKDIWYGEAMQRIRHQVMEGTAPEDCITKCLAQYADRRAKILTFLDPGDTFSLNPWRLGKKALSSLRRNGFKASYARGMQWLELRKKRGKTCP
ncbi:MAG: radical SAM protein [Candidatus Hydrogenedentes bacterium]|nr:radical SAM protein [Candidatus Hydrogenedentota bacterium]